MYHTTCSYNNYIASIYGSKYFSGVYTGTTVLRLSLLVPIEERNGVGMFIFTRQILLSQTLLDLFTSKNQDRYFLLW